MKNFLILLIHAFIIWALCGATMMIGPGIFGMETTLIIHAIGAPVFAGLVSWFYYKRKKKFSPLKTATIITLFIITMDAGLVAPVFEKSFEMFTSILGTWIPFALIFTSSLLVGYYQRRLKS